MGGAYPHNHTHSMGCPISTHRGCKQLLRHEEMARLYHPYPRLWVTRALVASLFIIFTFCPSGIWSSSSQPAASTSTSGAEDRHSQNIDEDIVASFSQRMLYLREEARGIFYHGFNAYMKHAYPWDELKPLSCTGRKWNERERGTLDDSLGGFSTTLVDSLDMLALIGDYAGFRKYVRMVIRDVHFDRNVNVSVFETNIRVLGGMLSAHMLLTDPLLGPILTESRLSEEERNNEVPPFSYNGELLDMSLDLGNRMLPAFRTKSGLPSHLVNLKYGIPKSNAKEAKETCVAAAGM